MTPVCNRSRKVLVFSVVECVTPVCNTSRKVLVFSVVNEFMSDIKKVDLGGGRAYIYIFIYLFIHLFQSWHVQDAIRLSLQLEVECIPIRVWRAQMDEGHKLLNANYRASLLIATTTPEKNIIVTIRSLLTIPPKSGNQKNRLGEQTRFKKNPWILASCIYIPYFGINRFPDLWILAIYIAPYFHHPQIAPNIRPCWGDFHSEHQTAEARHVWPGSGFNGKQELLKMGILCILNAFCTSWYDPISKKYKLYYQDMKELQSYQKVEIHPG